MKKLSLLFFCFISLSVLGQSYEGTIQYDKKKQTAFIIEYVYPPEAECFCAKNGECRV